MRSCIAPFRVNGLLAAATVAAAVGGGSLARAADAPEVIAVVATDGYADIRDQLGWIGEQVGNPNLAGFAESFLLLATQGKGLAGLDVKRPIGVVLTTAGGPLPAVHAFLPVKDLTKLLGAVQGMTGPVEEVDGVRRITVPGGPPVQIVEKNGWAILSPQDAPAGIDDPLALIDPLVKDYSLAVEVFPSRMPDDLRERLKDLLEEASRNAASRGQPMDAAALVGALDRLEDVEKLIVGFAVDQEKNLVILDNTVVIVPSSAFADVWTDAGKAAATVGSPATADGRPATVRAHYAQAVPPGARAGIEAGIAQGLAVGANDPVSAALAGLVGDLVSAMLETGDVDAGITIDASAADGTQPLPAVTIGMKVKDGTALEAQVKERLGRAGSLPPNVSVKFDAGRQGEARLHEITVDVSAMPAAERLGDTVVITLAVAPQYAYVLAGGDVPTRLAAAVAAGGKPIAGAGPITGVELSLASAIGYASRMMRAFSPDDPQGELLSDVAEQAAAKDATEVAFTVKPIERGFTVRLSADAGALQTVAASAAAQQAPPPLPAGRPRVERERERAGPALAP
jgi:hypothetical protein